MVKLRYKDLILDVEPSYINMFYAIYIAGEYDFLTIRQGDIVLDAGASWGDFSLKASKLVGKSGKIIAVEPDPVFFKMLKRNIIINQISNIIAVKKALSDVEGYCLIDYRKRIRVPTISVDNLLKENKVKKVDVLKMDIEGDEVKALKGSFLNNLREAAIETHGQKNYNVIKQILKDHEFTLYSYDKRTFFMNSFKNTLRYINCFMFAEFKSKFLATRSTIEYLLHRTLPVPASNGDTNYRIVYAKKNF